MPDGKLEKVSKFIRTITRPLLALGFGWAFIWLVYVDKIPKDAFVATGTAVILWWFKDRDRDNRTNGGSDAK